MRHFSDLILIGAAFADSVLDCMLSCVSDSLFSQDGISSNVLLKAYYNTEAINLLRIILMGGIDQELEQILTEGERFEPCSSATMLRKRKRTRIAIIPIVDLIPNIGTRVSTSFLYVNDQ